MNVSKNATDTQNYVVSVEEWEWYLYITIRDKNKISNQVATFSILKTKKGEKK